MHQIHREKAGIFLMYKQEEVTLIPNCPKCNSEHYTRVYEVTGPLHYIMCDSCGFKAEGRRTRNGATKTWNSGITKKPMPKRWQRKRV